MPSHLGICLNVGVTASYTTLQVKSLEEAIFRALAHIVPQSSSLSAIPMDMHTFLPYFVQIPQVDLGRAVTIVETM